MRKTKTRTIEWCGIPVVVDNATIELIHVPPPNEDLEQQLVFRVTQSTAEFVSADFERYRPTLELMAANWREEKERLLREKNANDQNGSGSLIDQISSSTDGKTR